MAKATVKNLDAGQLDFMWNFLKFKKNMSDVPRIVRELKEYCDQLRQAMIQKTGGDRAVEKGLKDHVDFDDIGTIINCIVIEAMELRIRGGLDFLLAAVEGEEIKALQADNERLHRLLDEIEKTIGI